MAEIVQPHPERLRYTCPYCHTLAEHQTAELAFPAAEYLNDELSENKQLDYYIINVCTLCSNLILWYDDQMLYPVELTVQPPNPDLPQDIKKDYSEAAKVAGISPRAAAALLRLCIQKLCKHLGGTGDHIDTDIATLVGQGLPIIVQQALDAVRVIGNNAVHPGIMDITDDHETVGTLFKLVNIIAQRMISDAKEIETLYSTLPESVRDSIDKRNKKAKDKALGSAS